MDIIAGTVLGTLGAATAGLTYYWRRYLPRTIEVRMRDSIGAFSRAVELRFVSHEGLTDEVLPLAMAIGRAKGLSASRMKKLEVAVQLRDIGLCAVPYKLINGKSFMRWTEEEKAIYQKHPELGAQMLESVPSLKSLAPIVRHHHSPYAGDPSLPLEARILKVVGDYVWSNRWQGEMLARTYLEQGRGSQYDPAIVEALFDVLTSSRVAQRAPELVAAAR